MHPVTLVVLAAATAATLWLAIYVFIYLPWATARQYRESLKAFATAVELRFPSHRGLSERVSRLSRAVGVELGLSQQRLMDLEMAATLRDIGLCAVPYALVNERSAEAWSESETRTYERHGEISGAMLELVPRLAHLAPIVHNHHVDYSSNEPVSGVLRSQVPIEAFILNAVTGYVWTSRLIAEDVARLAIENEAGTTYDPRVVKALLSVLPSDRAGAEPASPVRR